jgi:hypothetical protein
MAMLTNIVDLALLTWPPGLVPVEIFDEITRYLSRSDVKALRLVDHEFEEKVSAKYFHSVVVPFKSSLYDGLVSEEPDCEAGERALKLKARSNALFNGGMRIFQSFGQHISRFALSLELDEYTLAYPPIKPTQEAIPTYWGIYRWPYQKYNRYTELQGLEETADETGYMKEALKCLVSVKELGLCCDAGLGYLLGPDHNAEAPPTPHPVFTPDNTRYQPLQLPERATSCKSKPAFDTPSAFKYTVLETMVMKAGYAKSQAHDAVELLLGTEGTTLGNIDFDERLVPAVEPVEPEDPASPPASTRSAFELLDYPECPLIPKRLTGSQKEMLLELEWAHRALIQSYVIAIVDNAMDNVFGALTTLTIAKIPSSHVHMLERTELWDSLPTLTDLSLGVVADWREISKPAPGCLQDTSVSPLDAVPRVFKLLQTSASRCRNINHLHFEWICGGEFSSGITQRGQNILPAPFSADPSDMLQPMAAFETGKLLSLPYIRHLSLKNCWFPPAVFLQCIRRMALQSLRKLELESVSLTGLPTGNGNNQQVDVAPVVPVPEVDPVGQIALVVQPFQVEMVPFDGHLLLPPQEGSDDEENVAAIIEILAGNGVLEPQPEPEPEQEPANIQLRQPKLLSWAGIIDHLTPGYKIRKIISQGQPAPNDQDEGWHDLAGDDTLIYVPDSQTFRSHEKQYPLSYLSFKSCGYVHINSTLVSSLSRDSVWTEPESIQARRREYNSLMQTPVNNTLLASITYYLSPEETLALEQAFGMDTGWETQYSRAEISAAVADGVLEPGRGRFSGSIRSYAKISAVGMSIGSEKF